MNKTVFYIGCPLVLGLAGAFLLASCVSPPTGVAPIRGFELDRYLGKWYEIARLDHSFERNLTNVTAVYRESPDGEILVCNRGFDSVSKKWKVTMGYGKFIGPKSVGSLKVKVGAPFFGGYHVIALDREGYQYAMIAGPTRGFLWILSRKPTLSPEIFALLRAQAESAGFDTKSLIMVSQRSP